MTAARKHRPSGTRARRRRHRMLAAGLAIAVLAGCGTSAADPGAGDQPAEPGRMLSAEAAAAVLTEFDVGDSAAMAAGSITGLAEFETTPVIHFSSGAIRQAAAVDRPQDSFEHTDATFALPVDRAPCLIGSATITGPAIDTVTRNVIQFVEHDGTWKATHSVIAVSPRDEALVPTGDAIPLEDVGSEAGRDTLSQALFDRSIGKQPSDQGAQALQESELVDGRLAAGVELYRAELAKSDVNFERTLDRVEWSPCAAEVAGGSLTFVTLYATDSLESADGGTVELPANAPDAQTTGNTSGLKGSSVTVDRAQMYLVFVPTEPTGAGRVLGAADTAVSAVAD